MFPTKEGCWIEKRRTAERETRHNAPDFSADDWIGEDSETRIRLWVNGCRIMQKRSGSLPLEAARRSRAVALHYPQAILNDSRFDMLRTAPDDNGGQHLSPGTSICRSKFGLRQHRKIRRAGSLRGFAGHSSNYPVGHQQPQATGRNRRACSKKQSNWQPQRG